MASSLGAAQVIPFSTAAQSSTPAHAPLPTGRSIACKSAVEEYMHQSDWRVNANANVAYSNSGLVSNLAGKVIANYWLDEVYSRDAGEAHRNGDIHIHDLDCLTGYCAGWSLRQLLNEGFNAGHGRVGSNPPKHFREALGQMANFLGVLQLEWAGAQAFSSFDTYLAPYAFYDNLSFRDIKKAIRQFVYNVNVPSRWGQSPFTNITLDIVVPQDLQEQWPTYRDTHFFKNIDDAALLEKAKSRDFTIRTLEDLRYSHFGPEMEMIAIAYYEIMTEGDSHGQPFTFPIPTVNITEDFDWDSKVANAIFENTAKVGSSYFQNFVGSQYKTDENGNRVENENAYKPGAVRSMCCRLQLDLRELLKRGNGLFGSAEMTGSIGVVTLNLARLGYRFKGDWDAMVAELDRLMEVGRDALEAKRVFIQEQYDRGLYPYTRRYLRGFMNHFSTIGINGMNEMLTNFSNGRDDISTPDGMKMAGKLMDHMRLRLREFQEETGNLYNLEATPAEGTTYRFAKEDLKRFPEIKQSGNGVNVYYTNSSQLPAGYTDDPFAALDMQDELQTKYTGGTVLHLYMSEKLSSGEACKQLVKTVLENYRLPYITITPVFSVCQDHGYLAGEHHTCPHCHKETEVWTRVMGYYRPVSSFNLGKKGEHRERRFFTEEKADQRSLGIQSLRVA